MSRAQVSTSTSFYSIPLILLALVTTCIAAANQTFLPAPSGLFEVGYSVAELIDNSLTAPFAPDAQPRKLMISVYYPIADEAPTAPSPYMPNLTANYEDNYLAQNGVALQNGTLESVYLQLATHATVNFARDGNNTYQFPLVLFQPALGTTRLFYGAMASDLASHGYIIVTIDTEYDIDFVQYPDGSVTHLNATIEEESGTNITWISEEFPVVIGTRAQDVSFVLDQLENVTFAQSLIPNLPAAGLNTSHVTMYGHSIGGATAFAALKSDDRIAAGLNMDGAFAGNETEVITHKPFMIMAHNNNTRETADPWHSWVKGWETMQGWKRDIMIAGTLHYDFSDYPLVFEELGVMPENETIRESLLLGPINGYRAFYIVRTYLLAFLDYVVYGKDNPILDGETALFPEVTFEW